MQDFDLTPYDTEIDGTWEGKWKCRYTIEDGVRYAEVTAVGHGTGYLDGMKISVSTKNPTSPWPCDVGGSWPLEGYILDPNSQDE